MGARGERDGRRVAIDRDVGGGRLDRELQPGGRVECLECGGIVGREARAQLVLLVDVEQATGVADTFGGDRGERATDIAAAGVEQERGLDEAGGASERGLGLAVALERLLPDRGRIRAGVERVDRCGAQLGHRAALGSCGRELLIGVVELGIDGARTITAVDHAGGDVDRGGHRGERDREADAQDATAPHCRARRVGELRFDRRQLGGGELREVGELALAPQGVGRVVEALPGGGRRREARVDGAQLDGARQPLRECRPAVDEALVRELEQRWVVAARDDETAAHERVQRLAIAAQLVGAATRARALGRDEAEQDAASVGAVRGGERVDHGICMTREGAADAADRVERARADRLRRVARFPQLREGELEERELVVLGDERVDHRFGLEPAAVRACGSDDRLARALLAQRTQDVEAARQLEVDARDEIAAQRGEHAHAGCAACDVREHGRERGGFVARKRDELLELIDEHEHSPVGTEGAPQVARHGRGLVAHRRVQRGLVEAGNGCERGRERGQRALARDERHDLPRHAIGERAVDDMRQHSGATQRRLADTGVSGHDDERIRTQAFEHGADIGAAAEEQAAVLGLERDEAAIRVALGQLAAELIGRDALERLAQLVTGGWTLGRLAAQAARDRRRELAAAPDRRNVRGQRRRDAARNVE